MTLNSNEIFATRVPRASKRAIGRGVAAHTKLDIRVTGVHVSEKTLREVHTKLGRRLAHYATHVGLVTVRFRDVNGPRGGRDTLCRIRIGLHGLPEVVVAKRAHTAATAFTQCVAATSQALSRTLSRAGRKTPAPTLALVRAPTRHISRATKKPGSTIGRRVGRAQENPERTAARPEKLRRDAWVDTSLPGVSATDRKAGAGSTAARNTKLTNRRATATLEDSRTRPTRKSTRKSANRAKSGSKLSRRARKAAHTPKARRARHR